MKMSYQALEKKYDRTLHTIASSFNIKSELTSQKKLPYSLENATLSKLKPKHHWIISAISGSGKTTISKQLVSVGFRKLPNVTTRPRRSGEKNNDCVFINESKFLLWKHRHILFNPHKRNNVWHALLKKDIKKLTNGDSFIYLDKSVASAIALKKILPKKVNFTFVYILAPTFKDLYERILKREYFHKIKNGEYLSKKKIFDRFKEEIDDMKISTKLPYVYIVNDFLERVTKLLKKTIWESKKLAKK